ncbi:MAG: hypothetical protein AAF629_17850 [Chloroflexota bacterium]
MQDKLKLKSGRLVPNYTVIFVVLTLLILFACIYSVRVLELAVDIQEGQIQILEAISQSSDPTQTPTESDSVITVIVPFSPLASPETATPLPTPIPLDTVAPSIITLTNVVGLSTPPREKSTSITPTRTPTVRAVSPTATPTASRTATRTPSATATPFLPPPAIVLQNAHLDAPRETSNIRLLQWQWLGQTEDLPDGWFYVVRFLDGRNDLEPYLTKRIDEDTKEPIQYDGGKFTFRWDIFTLPSDEHSCQPYWQVALASDDLDCPLGTRDDKLCLLTNYSTAQNIGAINPSLTEICRLPINE